MGYYPLRLYRTLFSIACLFTAFTLLLNITELSDENWKKKNTVEVLYQDIQFNESNYPGKRIDWHGLPVQRNETNLAGPGEHGKAVFNIDPQVKLLEYRMIKKEGVNLIVSNMMSVYRSVPDVRNKNCRSKRYLASLPTVSIIIPCHNEYDSILKRTLHSIFNRSPKHLLEEIIIVMDNSNHSFSIDNMNRYVKMNFANLVKIIPLPERNGSLVYARNFGGKDAKGDVLIFLSARIECNYNWLPPLLEPIAIDYRIATFPIIDKITHDTFQYKKQNAEDFRGGFTTRNPLKMLPLRLVSEADKSKPYKNPIMTDLFFAINRKFFFNLGQFDVSLHMERPTQIEFSLRIWMGGGMILNVPCSRIGKVSIRQIENNEELLKNIVHIAEVWMDEYKYILYGASPQTEEIVKLENLNASLKLRKNLKSKSFDWFLKVIAPDLMPYFPIKVTNYQAAGVLHSLNSNSKYCLTTINDFWGSPTKINISRCDDNFLSPQKNQSWIFSSSNRLQNSDLCLECYGKLPNAQLHMMTCSKYVNQQWSYNVDKQWLSCSKSKDHCLELKQNLKTRKFRIVVNYCNPRSEGMRWRFGYGNSTALKLSFIKSKL